MAFDEMCALYLCTPEGLYCNKALHQEHACSNGNDSNFIVQIVLLIIQVTKMSNRPTYLEYKISQNFSFLKFDMSQNAILRAWLVCIFTEVYNLVTYPGTEKSQHLPDLFFCKCLHKLIAVDLSRDLIPQT